MDMALAMRALRLARTGLSPGLSPQGGSRDEASGRRLKEVPPPRLKSYDLGEGPGAPLIQHPNPAESVAKCSRLLLLRRLYDAEYLMNIFRSSVQFLVASATILATTASADIIVESGEKIGFLGDSITEGGWGNPKGYVHLVIDGLAANGVNAEAVPAGISGHKSNDMLARVERDVLSKKPQWMTLSCGVNDVWHGKKGVAIDDYKTNITAILDKAAAAGVKVVVTTATIIHENLESPENQKLAVYNEFLRTLAAERKVPLADLNAMFHERIKAENKPGKNTVTGDGVHMNYEGDKIMARGILKAFGCDDTQLKKADEVWAAKK